MRRSSLALAAGGLALMIAATAHAGPERPPPTEPRPGAAERWRITGRPETDGCAGRIVLAARNLTFRGSWLHADVVNRRYRLQRRGRARIADGAFEAPSACGPIRERWELREVSDDVLEGALESTWRLRPACAECTVRFAIRAVRVR